MTIHMPDLAKACDRHSLLHRAATQLLLQLYDVGIVTPQDSSRLFDWSRIRRARLQLLQENHFKHIVRGCYFGSILK